MNHIKNILFFLILIVCNEGFGQKNIFFNKTDSLLNRTHKIVKIGLPDVNYIQYDSVWELNILTQNLKIEIGKVDDGIWSFDTLEKKNYYQDGKLKVSLLKDAKCKDRYLYKSFFHNQFVSNEGQYYLDLKNIKYIESNSKSKFGDWISYDSTGKIINIESYFQGQIMEYNSNNLRLRINSSGDAYMEDVNGQKVCQYDFQISPFWTLDYGLFHYKIYVYIFSSNNNDEVLFATGEVDSTLTNLKLGEKKLYYPENTNILFIKELASNKMLIYNLKEKKIIEKIEGLKIGKVDFSIFKNRGEHDYEECKSYIDSYFEDDVIYRGISNNEKLYLYKIENKLYSGYFQICNIILRNIIYSVCYPINKINNKESDFELHKLHKNKIKQKQTCYTINDRGEITSKSFKYKRINFETIGAHHGFIFRREVKR